MSVQRVSLVGASRAKRFASGVSFGNAAFAALAILGAVACGAEAQDLPDGIDEASGSVAPTEYRREVKKELRQGCSSQQLTPSEVTFCQNCEAESDPSTHKSCTCSIKCTSIGVLKTCGCTTYVGGPTE